MFVDMIDSGLCLCSDRKCVCQTIDDNLIPKAANSHEFHSRMCWFGFRFGGVIIADAVEYYCQKAAEGTQQAMEKSEFSAGELND